jgi:AcrR family transcriptional regulator
VTRRSLALAADDSADADRAPEGINARRSAATRARLIAAAVAILQRDGYAAATTVKVAQEAGVSRGAMLHQFPTRADLIIAVAEHIVRTQDRERRQKLRQVERGEPRFKAITEVVWSTMQQPESMALLEIMLGSRSDPELGTRFPAVMRDLEAQLASGPAEVGHDIGVADAELIEAMTRLHLAAMRGLIIDRLFTSDDAKTQKAFDLLLWYKSLVVDRMLGR